MLTADATTSYNVFLIGLSKGEEIRRLEAVERDQSQVIKRLLDAGQKLEEEHFELKLQIERNGAIVVDDNNDNKPSRGTTSEAPMPSTSSLVTGMEGRRAAGKAGKGDQKTRAEAVGSSSALTAVKVTDHDATSMVVADCQKCPIHCPDSQGENVLNHHRPSEPQLQDLTASGLAVGKASDQASSERPVVSLEGTALVSAGTTAKSQHNVSERHVDGRLDAVVGAVSAGSKSQSITSHSFQPWSPVSTAQRQDAINHHERSKQELQDGTTGGCAVEDQASFELPGPALSSEVTATVSAVTTSESHPTVSDRHVEDRMDAAADGMSAGLHSPPVSSQPSHSTCVGAKQESFRHPPGLQCTDFENLVTRQRPRSS